MNKKFIYAGVAIVAILAIAGAVFFLTKDDDDSDKKSEETSENNNDDVDIKDLANDLDEEDISDLEDLVKDLDEEDLNAIEDSFDNGGVPACDYLTQSEAEKVLGGTVVQDAEGGTTSCTYSNSDATGGFALVTLIVSKSTKDGAKAMYDSAKTTTYGEDGENVDLDGADEAYWAAGYSQLSILDNDTWFIVSAISSTETDGKALSIKAAEYVLE